ncbi:glycosyltransferase family 4 protein [Cellulomonas sp. Sa3CUA2]|uniref:Glycosyltransferase family 4 protein n=1 Tax=Cellulomonas avistercoris TaxID=2762242 RepID=A0ABR8QFQ6_9CELL|nr:glycosyltransferase family 4 protein [Cellulomonas avistercoris]MBD7919245.1 glycosyltransferase family 4 protein [Cellulomonas avistercoris]
MATALDGAVTGARETPSDLGRVCLLGINYAPETTGIAPYTTAMARAWADAGATVDVVTGVPHYPAWRVEDERYLQGRSWRERDGAVSLRRVRHHVPATADLRGRARMEASFLRRAVPLVARSTADVVVAVTPSMSALAAAVAGARGRPVGAVVQDLTGRGAQESGSTGDAVASLIGRAEVALLRRCAAVGVITPQFATTLVAAGVPADRVVEVGNFTHVRPSDATRDEACARLGWDPTVFRVVHTGNMGRKQGLEHVVDAARLAVARGTVGVEMVLVGSGNCRDELVAAAAGLPTVRVLDPVDAERYPLVLAAADVLLLHERPGVREMCLPSKLTSYAAAARPVLAAVEQDGIAGRQLTEADAALVVLPGDPGVLLAAVERLRGDAALRDRLAAAAHRHGEATYGEPAARARYVALLRRLESRTSAVVAA